MNARRLSFLGDRESGITLAELMVTMFIMGIVIAATVTLTIGVQRTNAQNNARIDQIESARTAVERMTRTLRTSVMPTQLGSCSGCTEDAFVLGEEYRVQFYANIDNPGNSIGPSKVTYEVVSTGAGVGNLVQRIQIPDSPVPDADGYDYCDIAPPATPTAACLSRVKEMVIARGVQTGTGSPIFAYYRGNSTRLNPSGGALTASQLETVLAVELRLTVQEQDATRAKPTTYIQRIMLPNAQAVIRQGEEETP